jgi:hypothetical protein
MNHRRNLDLLLLLLLCGGIRLLICALGTNMPGDADARLVTAAKWAADPHLIYDGIWLPFHYYAMGILMFVIPDPLAAGKLLSFFLGTLTLIPFFFLTESIFGRPTAVIAGLFFAIYGNQAGLSAVTMSEAPFGFLCVWAIYKFFKGMSSESGKTADFLFSACLLALAGGFRQEAWQLTGILSILMFSRAETRKLSILFALIGLSTYIAWTLAGALLANNELLSSLTNVASAKAREAQYAEKNVLYNAIKWIWIFLQSPGPIISALAVYGLFRETPSNRASALLALVAALLLGPYVVLSLFRAEWTPQHRYTFLFGILILPFAAKALLDIIKNRATILRRGAVVVVALVSLVTQAAAYGRHSERFLPYHDYLPSTIDAWTWLSSNINSDDRVIVEDFKWESYGIVYNSGLYKGNFVVVHYLSESELKAIVEKHCPTMIVRPSDRESKWKFIDQDSHFVELHRNEHYLIGRLKPRPDAPIDKGRHCPSSSQQQ